MPITQSLFIQSAGYASPVSVEKSFKARIGILSFVIKRQFVFCNELVSFLRHTIFHELVLITARATRLIGETFLQFGNAFLAGTCALIEALALLVVILCTPREKANKNRHQQNQITLHYLFPFNILRYLILLFKQSKPSVRPINTHSELFRPTSHYLFICFFIHVLIAKINRLLYQDININEFCQYQALGKHGTAPTPQRNIINFHSSLKYRVVRTLQPCRQRQQMNRAGIVPVLYRQRPRWP